MTRKWKGLSADGQGKSFFAHLQPYGWMTGNVHFVRSDLWVIEVGQALRSETLWQLALDGDILNLVAQQFMVNVTRHWGLVHRKSLQGALHPASTQMCVIITSSSLNLCAYQVYLCAWSDIFTLQMIDKACLHKCTSCKQCKLFKSVYCLWERYTVMWSNRMNYDNIWGYKYEPTCQRTWTSTQSRPGSCEGFPQVLQHCYATQWQFHPHSL